MDYCIRNGAIFIKLNESGAPVTCGESQKGLFEFSKAKNICASLPKTLKKMNFKVEGIPDIPPKVEEERVITTNTYVPSENVSQWLDKFGQCADILSEADQRMDALSKGLSDADKEFQDIIHEIEITGKYDMYQAWLKMGEIIQNRKRRRDIKDEMLIISNVFRNGLTYLKKKDNIQKSVDGLSKRKYRIRIVEEDEES